MICCCPSQTQLLGFGKGAYLLIPSCVCRCKRLVAHGASGNLSCGTGTELGCFHHQQSKNIHILGFQCHAEHQQRCECDCFGGRTICKHGVNLTCGNAITTGRVDPNRNITAAGIQFVFEHPGCDVIVEPTFLGNGAVQFKDSLFGLTVFRQVFPRPELLRLSLHWFPPFL